MTRTPIEQAAVFLSIGRYRRAAEILIQIIIEQEKRIVELEKRLPKREENFADGLGDGPWNLRPLPEERQDSNLLNPDNQL